MPHSGRKRLERIDRAMQATRLPRFCDGLVSYDV